KETEVLTGGADIDGFIMSKYIERAPLFALVNDKRKLNDKYKKCMIAEVRDQPYPDSLLLVELRDEAKKVTVRGHFRMRSFLEILRWAATRVDGDPRPRVVPYPQTESLRESLRQEKLPVEENPKAPDKEKKGKQWLPLNINPLSINPTSVLTIASGTDTPKSSQVSTS